MNTRDSWRRSEQRFLQSFYTRNPRRSRNPTRNGVIRITVQSNRHLNRNRIYPISTNGNQLNFSNTVKPTSHGVGITGFNRFASSNKSRYLWMLAFAVCVMLSFYELGTCFYEYYSGKPAVKVIFVQRQQIKLPRLIACPLDLINKNPVTEYFRNLYGKKFNIFGIDRQSIPFSELLKLDGINMTSLWNLYEINLEKLSVHPTCSVSKSDRNCAKSFEIQEVANAGGRCVSILIKGFIDIFAPLTRYQIRVNPPNLLTKEWLPQYSYVRYFHLPQEQNPRYAEVDMGGTAPLESISNLAAETIEINNVNWMSSPCEDPVKVELCIEKCIEEYLYSQVNCRLPYMTRVDLKDCDTPESFNRSFLITEEAMLRKFNCTKNCPRKCKEELALMRQTIMKVYKVGKNIFNFYLINNVVLVIQEYQHYTFNDLLANIGGTLGFFLDMNVLTLFEILEVSIIYFTKLRKKKRRKQIHIRHQSQNIPKLDSNKIQLSISGINTLLNKKAGFLRKLCWATVITILTTICIYQIYKFTLSFIYGDPEVLLTTERNFSIIFPTFTVCPYEPYKHWDYIHNFKDAYQFEFNSTEDINDIPLSDVMKVPDNNILDFWNDSGVTEKMIGDIDFGCKRTLGVKDRGLNEKTITSTKTVNGQCLTIQLNGPLRFKGVGTRVCITFKYMPETTASHSLCLLLHSEEDDVRTLDPHQCFPITNGLVGQIPISVRKREYVNTKQHPCGSPFVVAKCQSKCYDSLMDQAITCRVPFMKNTTLELCRDADAFNRTMETAFNIMRNYSGRWCNCPRKCQEYIYDIHLSGLRMAFPFSVLALSIPNNIFLVTKEYNRINFTIFFASICGSLGLYFGICCFHIIEILECFWLLLVKNLRDRIIR